MSNTMLNRLFGSMPTNPLARRIAAQSMLFTLGEGLFLTGSAVYFTQIVGLKAAQVGLGMTIAGIVTFFLLLPLGRLSDRIGAKRLWTIAALVEAVLYLSYPFISDFVGFLAVITLLDIAGAAAGAGCGAYMLDAFSREERVRSQAFMRSALNIGFALGAMIGGFALAAGSDAGVAALPVLTAAILVVNGLMVAVLPHARPGGDGIGSAPATTPAPAAATKQSAQVAGALRNIGFTATKVCDGVLGTHHVVLNVVIPLWLVQQTDAPRVLLAWLVGTNTMIAILFQVAAARGSNTLPGALRAMRVSAAFFVMSCAIIAVTHDTLGWVTISVVLLGHVTLSVAELFQSAGSWGLTAELSDPARRGEYQGMGRVGITLGSIWAPAVYTLLAMELGAAGWLVIAMIVVLAALAIGRASERAEQHLREVTGLQADAAAVTS